jgi:ABC-type polysaccharide/polyol phosphate transport system ATPase subunit
MCQVMAERALRPGEIKIEGLGKRYWIRAGTDAADGDEVEEAGAFLDDDDDEPAYTSLFKSRTEHWALREINCHITPGERVAVVGANGSGKSTLIRILSRTLPPSEGTVEGAGTVVPFAALKNPLSQEVSGCENLRMLARLLGIPLDQLEERLPEIIAFSELGVLAHEKVARYSDRSFTRLSTAMGLFIDADIYLIDNAVKGGDAAYQAKVNDKLAEVLSKTEATVVFASNSLPLLGTHCRRALLLAGGRLVGDADVNTIIQRFLAKSELLELDEIAKPGSEEETLAVPIAPLATPVVVSSDRLQPMTQWMHEVAYAEKIWQAYVTQWREKPRPVDVDDICPVVLGDPCALATVHSLLCVTARGEPLVHCLPGETIFADLMVETFEPQVKISVRLEVDDRSMLYFVAEPVLPFVAAERGKYLFRAEIDGRLFAHAFDQIKLKLRTRVMFDKLSSGEQGTMTAKVRFDLRGDTRFKFDEERMQNGALATCIVEPMHSDSKLTTEIESGDARSVAPPIRQPALRPRLNWTIYRVADPPVEPSLVNATGAGAS